MADTNPDGKWLRSIQMQFYLFLTHEQSSIGRFRLIDITAMTPYC